MKWFEWFAIMTVAARVRQLEDTLYANQKPLSKEQIAEAENYPWLLSGVIPEHYTESYKKLCKKRQKNVLSILKKNDACDHVFAKVRNDDWKYKDCVNCGLRLFFNGNVTHNGKTYSYNDILSEFKIMMNQES